MRLWLSYTICQRHIGQTEYRRFQQSKRRTFRAWCAGAIMKLCLQKHNLHARSHGRPAGPGRMIMEWLKAATTGLSVRPNTLPDTH